MAISTSLRNKLVGFVIVASTILIFLPLVLSKDMIKKEAPADNAVAISSNGAIRDANGNLVPQAPATFSQAVNPLGQGEQLAGNNVPYGSNIPELNANLGSHSNVDLDNGVEMLEFSGPHGGPQPSGANANANALAAAAAAGANRNQQPEILGGATNTPPQSKQPEILVAPNNNQSKNNNKPATTSTANNAKDKKPEATPAKIANSDKPKTTASKQNDKKPEAKTEPGTKVIAGSRPSDPFVIQVGVFAKRSNVDSVVAKLKKAGISVYAIEVKSANKTLYRVYAGHANSRAALNNQVAQIDKLCRTKSKIVSL